MAIDAISSCTTVLFLGRRGLPLDSLRRSGCFASAVHSRKTCDVDLVDLVRYGGSCIYKRERSRRSIIRRPTELLHPPVRQLSPGFAEGTVISKNLVGQSVVDLLDLGAWPFDGHRGQNAIQYSMSSDVAEVVMFHATSFASMYVGHLDDSTSNNQVLEVDFLVFKMHCAFFDFWT